jgi:diacylglycerol kinase family enzyme
VPVLGLLGGDLCRTLGGLGDEARLRSEEAMTFPVDLGSVLVDGRLHWFVAHLIARRSWWHGRAVAVMNAQWLGDWDLGPRSHPNDGLLDATDGTLPLGDRLAARRRVRTGTHLPHPALRTTRAAAMAYDLDPALEVRLDGESVGRAHHLAVRVEPDVLTVVV